MTQIFAKLMDTTSTERRDKGNAYNLVFTVKRGINLSIAENEKNEMRRAKTKL